MYPHCISTAGRIVKSGRYGRHPLPGDTLAAIDNNERNQLVQASLSRWFQTKWVGAVQCPICKTYGWTMGDVVDIPVRYPRTPQSTHYALLPVSCNNCGNTLFVNANPAGAFDAYGNPVAPPPEINQ